MKVKIELDETLGKNELILRCASLDDEVIRIQKKLQDLVNQRQQLQVSKRDTDYFVVLDDIIFFETADNQLAVHTAEDLYFSKYKLYELEELLPGCFLRVSKSTIINVNRIRAIQKNIAGASQVEFQGSDKKAFVSRNYYKILATRLEEKRLSK